MISAELYKLATHRTPRVCAALLLVGVITPSLVMMVVSPRDTGAYAEWFETTLEAVALMVAVVFGGWLLGAEYHQGTTKRVLASEPRRARVLAAKGGLGAVAVAAVVGLAGVAGWAVARVAASMQDATVTFNPRLLAGLVLASLVAAAVAFALSTITRSETFAVVATFGLLAILDPMLSDLPKVGKYTLGSALASVQQAVQGGVPSIESSLSLATITGVAVLAAWMLALLGVAVVLFRARDV